MESELTIKVHVYHVDTDNGHDGNPGTEDRPFLTLEPFIEIKRTLVRLRPGEAAVALVK